MEKSSRIEIFASNGPGVSTNEYNINTDKFIVINNRIYSVKVLVQAKRNEWQKCPGGHIDLPGVELIFSSGANEFVGFTSVEDRDIFFSYFQRWLFDDETYNVININYYSKRENNENN